MDAQTTANDHGRLPLALRPRIRPQGQHGYRDSDHSMQDLQEEIVALQEEVAALWDRVRVLERVVERLRYLETVVKELQRGFQEISAALPAQAQRQRVATSAAPSAASSGCMHWLLMKVKNIQQFYSLMSPLADTQGQH